MKLERIQQGIASTITVAFTGDGVAEDPTPDSATVTLTRDSDGTTLGPYDAYDTGAGTFSHTLNPTETAGLDGLTAAWTVTFDGYEQTLHTRVEVVGGFVFTIADARNLSGLDRKNNDDTYRISTARIAAARTEVERALEQELCFAMVPRYTQTTLEGNGATVLALAPYPRVIRTATVNGAALTTSDLTMTPTGYVYNAARWTEGFQNVVVGYEHGLDYPPPRARDVALKLVRAALVGTPADDRASSVSTEQETTVFYTPGASEPFSLPEANRFVAANTLRTGIA